MDDNYVLPNHVGIIMDGNGRWAKKRGLKRSFGHKAGANNLEKLLKHIFSLGIKYVSVYAFSTENFKRSEQEVSFIMGLFTSKLKDILDLCHEEKIRVVFSGRKENFPNDFLVTRGQCTSQLNPVLFSSFYSFFSFFVVFHVFTPFFDETL